MYKLIQKLTKYQLICLQKKRRTISTLFFIESFIPFAKVDNQIYLNNTPFDRYCNHLKKCLFDRNYKQKFVTGQILKARVAFIETLLDYER